jgi:Holliday junction resolvase RusA-like endonuclease
MNVLKIVYPVLPPTSNKIYFRGTILTTKAREYAETFSMVVTREYLPQINFLSTEALYAVHLRFYFPTVINDTFRNIRVPPSKQAKTRYKKFDLTNRIKLLEDCVRDAIGVDDSQTFVASQEKHMDPDNPRVEIYIHEVNPIDFGIPRAVLMR